LIHLLGTFALVAFVVLFTVIIGSIDLRHRPLSWGGFVVGIVGGAYAGLGASQLLRGLGLAIFGLRNEELLVKYHDLARLLAAGDGHVFGDHDRG
jgi:hypothetical protein